uniref:Uncharacterized protein n=1 Tax=Globodera rostochiensis TaxID=31243 RepID=A0A914IFT8_GLORO
MPKASIFALFILFFVSFGRAIEEPQNEGTVVKKTATANTKTLAPIILLHGYLASKAYVDGQNIPFPDNLKNVCLKNWKHLKAWISPWLGDGPVLNRQGCLLHMLSLQYDPTTKLFSNQPNVNITFLGDKPFGSVCPVVCLLSSWDTSWSIPCQLNSNQKFDEAQFMPMVQYFEKEHGYERDVTLLGAAYDWRRTANMGEFN